MEPAEVTSYSELISAIRDQVGRLEVRYQDFDVLAGFAPGLTGKAFGPAQVKRLGPEKLFDALRACGLRLRVEEDAEQVEKMRHRITESFLPRQANQARSGNHSHPLGTQLRARVLRQLASNGGKATARKLTKAERSANARHAINQRWIKYRKLRAKVAQQRRKKDRKRAILPAFPGMPETQEAAQ